MQKQVIINRDIVMSPTSFRVPIYPTNSLIMHQDRDALYKLTLALRAQ